ncbi:hypothetical protein CH278_02065 [Rhodococcus sp. 05-2254-5]|nr:hypothetical protein CH278_02065 [Rhodococcus sp. 05-2254-5]OZE59032.1 hypothetical protein CH269_08560 [Rhodococcus sp. 05-2254-1]
MTVAIPKALRPKNLRPRGAALWRDLTRSEPDAVRAVVIAELCRMADQLDRINELLAGDSNAWATVTVPKSEGDGDVVLHLRVDALLVERRQTITTLRQLASQLKLGTGGGSSDVGDAGASFLDALAQSVADRFAETAAQ